ncbi:SufE family protein [Actinobacillus equuli subsp. equuli]|uniref:SufE family protein n=1 Tax=Actinobacillus equuli TaxID=718 RepID=UPI0024181A85|nr:SufE family protein [Actinobacillus equuli]MDG4951663.1 SufE family protein [Actinobacillus equuli subsp. equuli]WGE42328.1 SufE family protein [Actinobacillus equuli subsp. haemolyticus]WGE49744.1 SufE family protein [Actinobacillus equuli subsp. equuli]WGE53047.1 SufE family protein [Actinobacillus equuli subsp. haemolyticus]WGE55152.1 SufE family protein [Actinobacillus equuli subsp. equuli]
MTLADIYQKFELCKSWEERYRLLIQLSRQLAKPTEEELAKLPEIHGCESRLWFEFQATPRKVHAYSDARLMQGILFIVVTLLNEVDSAQLAHVDLTQLFEQLKISQNLTSTRLNGLQQINKLILTA